jgi:hypothetical protein
MLPRSIVLACTGAALALAPLRAPDLPPQVFPVYGGSGGSAFTRSCGAGRVLTGLRFRAGLSLDAIGLLCRNVNADGSLGTESAIGTLAGGGGGTAGSASCPAGTVGVGGKVYYGTYVDGLILYCRTWNKSTRSVASVNGGQANAGRFTLNTSKSSICELSTQPVVALRGREAGLVDAIGLTCDEP